MVGFPATFDFHFCRLTLNKLLFILTFNVSLALFLGYHNYPALEVGNSRTAQTIFLDIYLSDTLQIKFGGKIQNIG